MLAALLYGLAASSALLIGAVVGAYWSPPKAVTGTLLAFASGALISALAFELFEEAYRLGGAARAGLGLLAGAAVFIGVDTALERLTGGGSASGRDGDSGGGGPVGWALLAAVTLDGVPENLALGVSLAGGASAALLVAIFASNLPEALVSAVAMRDGGRGRGFVVSTWVACGALLAAAVVMGDGLGSALGDPTLAVALGFAGGAVLASLADTLMPEAYADGGPLTAFATAAGFFLSFVLAV